VDEWMSGRADEWRSGRADVWRSGGADERTSGGCEDRVLEWVSNRMAIDHFRELRVYQQSFKAAMRIFELSKTWPSHERYSLTSQIRRSARAVSSNIAEAWAKRRYPQHFISKLTDSDAEAAETQGWLDYALACGYLSQADFEDLNERYFAISGGLVKMMTDPARWCGPSNLVREPRAEYEIEL